MKRLIAIIALAACGAGASNSAARRDTLASVPEPAAAALRRLAAGAAIERVEREHERGREVYEAAWYVDGLEHEAAVTATGEVVELEEEIAAAHVPAAVRAAAVARLSNPTSWKFVKLMSGDYEVEARVDGREQEIVVSPDGRVRGGGDDDDDDGDGDDDDDDDDDDGGEDGGDDD